MQEAPPRTSLVPHGVESETPEMIAARWCQGRVSHIAVS